MNNLGKYLVDAEKYIISNNNFKLTERDESIKKKGKDLGV